MKTHLSDLTVNETIDYLESIGDQERAQKMRSLVALNPGAGEKVISELPQEPQLERAGWRGTEHAFGYIKPYSRGGILEIDSATALSADRELAGERVHVILAGLFTMNYPGWGRHNLLLQFTARHHDEKGKTVKAQFQQKFVSREGEGTGSLGNFIFAGLRVPPEGMEFEVQVVNLSNEGDEAALGILEGDVIKKGLNLAVAAIPSLETITALGEGIWQLVLSRNRNKIVQSFNLGLVLSGHAGPLARLREGTFVAAQAPRDTVHWEDWVFDSGRGLIVMKDDAGTRLPWNHLLFTITKAG